MLVLGFNLFFLFWQISDLLRPNLFSLGILLIVLYLGWTVYKMFRNSKERKKRIADLQAFAAANGWTCVQSSYGSNFPNWRAYPILDRGGEKIRPLLQREYDGGHAFLFDFIYRQQSGKVVRYYTQTMIAFQSPRLNLPFFALAQETIGSQMGELFGYRDIDFASHPQFSQKYHLAGKEEFHIRAVFNPQVLGYLESLPNLQIDAGGNCMFIYHHASLIPVEQLNDYLGMGIQIYNLFRL